MSDDIPSIGLPPPPGATAAPASAEEGQHFQQRTALLSHMRHELRTSLNAILGYSEMLIEEWQDVKHEDLLTPLRQIHESGERLLTLVNIFFTQAKAEEGQEERDTMLRALSGPLSTILSCGELLLQHAADIQHPGLLTDLQKMHAGSQRFLALVDHALLPTTADAELLSVPGLPQRESLRPREGFAQTMPPVERLQKGTQPTEGSLLVVDDNAANRDMLSQRLIRQGYEVAVAENGREALAMLQTRKFDLVLLDVMMPEMNGYQVLEHLKATNTLHHMPVIMISSLDEIDSVVHCIEMGAEDYLPKPFNPVLLRARIDACLEKKRWREKEAEYLRQLEQEKHRSDELLHVILPHEIVAELKATNTVTPRRYEHVAVLFCDIVGFTSYCEGRQPEEVVSHLQTLVEAFEDLTVQYALSKMKTIGDAFMATAGLLKPVPNPVLSCVQCAWAMIATAQQLPPQWTMRVGIHVGPVVAGVVGRRKYLFDIWGDTVNTAARVESHGMNGSVNVSGPAWQDIASQCRGVSLGLVSLKGKGAIELFRVDGLREL